MINIETIIRGCIGIITLLLLCYACSSNKKKINRKIVLKGLFIQLVFAICILKIKIIESLFQGISNIFLSILDFTKDLILKDSCPFKISTSIFPFLVVFNLLLANLVKFFFFKKSFFKTALIGFSALSPKIFSK